jgi:hypothetical protein
MTNGNSFFCYMTALSSEQRLRHQELGNRLLSALIAVHELPDGYEFEFPLNNTSYTALTEITFMEHVCCPFFNISIRLEPAERLFWHLSGVEGIKQFIQAEFVQWFKG